VDARDLLDLIWLVPALPAAGAVVLLVVGKRIGEPASGWLATGLMALSFAASVVAFGALFSLDAAERSHVSELYTWIQAGGFDVAFGFLVDPLSVTMILFVTFTATLIHLYAIGYMHGDPRFSRFFAYMNLFAASMLVLVLGSNFLVTFLGWEGVGLCSFLLISFWFERNSAAVAGKKAFVTNRVGDFGFMLAMFLVFLTFGTLDYSALHGAGEIADVTATAIALLLFLGAVGKSAQLPLHIWLPDAMEGPTPVSALIHAATMVTAGVFLVARGHMVWEASDVAGDVVAWVGAITALFAATVAVMQNDIKRVLAYSTVSQLGYMFLAVGIGAYAAGIFHMVTHAFFKALLFLGAGSVIHGLHDEQDMRRMGGLKKYLPLTAWTFIAGWLAIAGVFPFAGFWSKDEILGQAWFDDAYALWAIGLLAAFLTAFYMTRQVWLVFYANERFREPVEHHEPVPVVAGAAIDTAEHPEPRADEGPRDAVNREPHESPWLMTVPLVVLAILATVSGALNLPFVNQGLDYLAQWLEPVFEDVPEIHPTSFSAGLVLATVALAVALVGIALGVRAYRRGLDEDGSDPTERRLGGFAAVLANAYYLDAAWSRLVAGPGRTAFAWLADTFDAKVVDGAVNGVGWLARSGGDALRRVQTGRVRNYALAIVAGVVVLFVYVLTRVV
jgi:NADH-quinone oxidoreductase subunit L